MVDKKLFENILLEYNKQDMKARFGNELTNRFWNLRNRLPGNLPEKDLNWWFSNNKSSEDLDAFLTDWETGNRRSNRQIHRDNLAGAEMLYDDEYIRIYKVTTYDAAKVLGRGTTWCICGLYPGHERRGQHYFDSYIEDYGIKPFYVMVFDKKHRSSYRSDVNGNSSDYEKWCVLFSDRGSAYSRSYFPVWRSDDANMSEIPGIPADHQAQPLPGLTIPYAYVAPVGDSTVEPGQADDIASHFTIENGILVGCDINSGTVRIPDTVTEIGEDAFYNCASLESITIPDTVTKIDERAFENCSWLKSITIPDSVTELGIDVFKHCTSLQNVKLSANITEIPVNAFASCSSLESIIIPNGVTEISINAFKFCYALQNVVIPNSVELINYGAFAYCTSLKSITIPNSVTDIGITAFEHCHEDLVISTDNEVIINYCDQTGTNYRRITPQHAEESEHVDDSTSQLIIENGVVTGCNSMAANIRIPETVTEIGEYAFEDCTSLKSVIIPNSVTKIGEFAFYDCSSLESVVIPNSVTEISPCTFFECTSLQSVNIPDSVTKIGLRAFDNCTSLRNIEIPNSVTYISFAAFKNCRSLESINIPSSVTKIGVRAFEQCESLKSITIPNSVTLIGSNAFNECTSLESITIPNSVRNIGNNIFSNCHANLVVNTDNELVINYCEQNNINYQRITSTPAEEPQHVDVNDFRTAFNMAMRNRMRGN